MVVYAWAQGRTEAEQLRVSRLWRYVASLVSALPHRCVPVLFTDWLEKTACVGMLTVVASPLKLLPLGAALLSWKIATAPFYANFWKNKFCVLSTLIWLMAIHSLAILQVYALGLIMFVCLMLCCTQWCPLRSCILWVRSYNGLEDQGNKITYSKKS